MTWILLIIIVVIGLYIYNTQKQNKEIENAHLENGGFRKSFPVFTNHMDNYHKMDFVNDTGRSFSFSKSVIDTDGNFGKLIVGVKLDMRREPIIYSKYKSSDTTIYSGIDVSGVDFQDILSIDKCLNISIKRIKEQIFIDYNI